MSSIGQRLLRLSGFLRREADARIAAHDITDAQWKPLWLLFLGRATTPAELSRDLDVDAGAMTRMLDRLEAKGLLTRQRSAADRRVVQLELSDAGRQVVERVRPVLASVNDDLMREFSDSDRRQLEELLDRLIASAVTLPAVAAHCAAAGVTAPTQQPPARGGQTSRP